MATFLVCFLVVVFIADALQAKKTDSRAAKAAFIASTIKSAHRDR
jgi:hypothetical protein